MVGALLAVLMTSAIAAVASRSGGGTERASRQVVAGPEAEEPPVDDSGLTGPATTVGAPPPAPPSSISTTTTGLSNQLGRAAAAGLLKTPRPAPLPVAVPLTLPSALAAVMTGVDGCLVVEDEAGALETVFDHNSSRSFVPASSQKVLVAAAVLSRLGPDFRFETQVVAPQPARDGVLEDAWLVGGGDPYLATPDYGAYLAAKPRSADAPVTHLTSLADELASAGVRSIPAGLHVDETRYPPQRSVPTWKPSYVTEGEVGSLGALTVNEGLASWGPDQRVSPDPAASAASALGRLLGDRGVSLPGPAVGGRAPSGAVVIATVRSAPIGQILGGMLRSSDNYVAEMLVKELDRQMGGPGLTASGTTRVVEELRGLGVDVAGVRLNDGSGLDTGNRATCRALLGALRLSRTPQFAVLDSGLAIAGRTGTLAKRYVGSPAEVVLAAKTGWINGAGSMVGRLAISPVRRFALIFNGQFGWPYARDLQDRVVAALTSDLPLASAGARSG